MAKRLNSPHIWKPDEPVETNARLVLPAMAREYFAAGRKLVKHKTRASKMHPFRLSTKRFRYTLEIFRDLYGPSMDDRLELLKPVQDALGDVNDCVATRDAFDQGKKFDKYLKSRGEEKAEEFRKTWTETFDAAGQEEQWVQYLAGVPAEPKTPAKKTAAKKTGPKRTKAETKRSSKLKPSVNGQDLAGHEPRRR